MKILSESDVITNMTTGYDYVAFAGDERTKRAVCMTLINIGELVKSLSDELRDTHKDIPWRAIAGLRDVTAHRYQTLRMEDIWETIQQDIPALADKFSTLL